MFGAQKTQELDAECVLARGLSLEKVPGITEQTILYIQPCASVQGRVNCELRLGIEGVGVAEEFFEFETLSRILEAYADRFAESRASNTLGAARIQWRGKKILIFRNGRIVIREALDENDVQTTLEFLSKLLAPSIRCVHCGEKLTECAVGLCHSCLTRYPTIAGETRTLIWKQVYARFESLLAEAFRYKSDVASELKKENLQPHSSLGEIPQTQFVRASRLLLDFLVSSNERRDLIAGLALLKAVWSLESVLEAFTRLQIRSISANQVSNDRLMLSRQLLGILLDWIAGISASLAGRYEKRSVALDEKEVSEASSALTGRPPLDVLSVEILGKENVRLLEKLARK